VDQVREEIRKIVSKQKRGSPYDLSRWQNEIGDLLLHTQYFDPRWKSVPIIFRIAKIRTQGSSKIRKDHSVTSYTPNGEGIISYYSEDILLPDVTHDLELVIKMLNYMRGQKGLLPVEMPLFLQPSDIRILGSASSSPSDSGAINNHFKCSRNNESSMEILSQMCIGFQKAAIMFTGFVFGRHYIILEA
jgi:hypothetical protein